VGFKNLLGLAKRLVLMLYKMYSIFVMYNKKTYINREKYTQIHPLIFMSFNILSESRHKLLVHLGLI